MIKKVINQNDESFNYLLTYPDNHLQTEGLPLIVFLHGAGECGDNLENITVHGIPKYAEKVETLPVITVSPQCKYNQVWLNRIKDLHNFISKISQEFKVSCVNLIGMSMGGFGVWQYAMDYAEELKCIVPICGGGMSWRAGVLKNLNIKAFHGDDDAVVPAFYSIDMVDAVNANGGKAELTLFHNVGHDSWTKAFEECHIVDWILDKCKE